MGYTKLFSQQIAGGTVKTIADSDTMDGYRLSLPAGPAGQYRLAQLDDYTNKARSQFPLHPPAHLRLSARTSSTSIPGTWGMGMWNNPFGLSLGFSEGGFRLPTLPNALWFFHASPENYLSFKSIDATAPEREVATNGFLAQVFHSPRFHPSLIPTALAFPFSRKTARRLLGRIIHEDGIRLHIDPTHWHSYQLEWREEGVSLGVDGEILLESSISPRPPLGLVIWIDNQYAAFTPEGQIGFGVLENPEPAWLEIKDLDVT